MPYPLGILSHVEEVLFLETNCDSMVRIARNSPDRQIYRDDTADDMALCISGIVLGMTGLRLWLACVHKGNISTS